MIDPDTVPARADDIRPGDLVDLESCPILHGHPSAEFEYAEVAEVERSDGMVMIGYLDIGPARYNPDRELRILRRELLPPRSED